MEIEDKLDLSASQTIIPLVTRAGNPIQLFHTASRNFTGKNPNATKTTANSRSYLRYRVVRKR
jgi:hypothetical protein